MNLEYILGYKPMTAEESAQAIKSCTGLGLVTHTVEGVVCQNGIRSVVVESKVTV